MNKLFFIAGTAIVATLFSNSVMAFPSFNENISTESLIINDQHDGVIRGSISGLEAEDTLMVRTKNQTDTVAVHNGSFEYTFSSEQAELVNFYSISKKLANGNYRAFRMNPISVMLFPNDQVSVKGNFDVYQVTGSKFYDEYNQMNAPLLANDKKRMALSEEYSTIARSAQPDKQRLEAIREEFQKIGLENDRMIIDYVGKHLDSDLSVFLLYYFHPEAGEKQIDHITKEVQNGALSHLYKEIKAYYDKVVAKREASKYIQEGKMAPDFTLKDLNGKDFSLSSLKGKYVVLDFWGSWCGWCIKGMPKMKEMYAKYKGKLEIVGIDCNDPESKWKAAVAKHALPWINVINNPKGGADMTNVYNISGFPTKLIIAPDGKIAKIVVGEDPAFYTAIDEFMK